MGAGKRNRAAVSLALALLLTVASGSLSGQTKVLGDYVVNDPQVWSFMKYGGQTPDLYTGTVRAEIPVYTYRDQDFEIPLSLVYASNGYMPNVQANYVGLGWSLNVGGCITRKVNGIRDESIVSCPSAGIGGHPVGDMLYGHYLYASVPHSVSPVLERRYYSVALSDSNVGSEYCFFSEEDGRYYETKPDEFSFRFLGYSGKFVIGDTGDVSVFDSNLPAGELSIGLEDLSLGYFKSKISIRTGDGYEYEFGGILSSDDHDINDTVSILNGSADGDHYVYGCDVWHLRRIVAPNGRSVEFAYSVARSSTMSPRGSRVSQSVAYASLGWPSGSLYGSESSWTDHYMQYTSNVAQLTCISIGGVSEIRFSYGSRPQEESRRGWLGNVLPTPSRLSGISVVDVVSSPERSLLECTLSHRYGQGNPVMMLSSVRIAGLGTYRMTYSGEDGEFPYQGCVKVDHWGFYNSNPYSTISSMMPTVMTTDDYTEVMVQSNREPDYHKTMTGMLERMEYPAGGWTEFRYGMRRYGRKVERSVHSAGVPELEACAEGDGGGLHVVSVTDHASDGVSTRREYEYGVGTMLLYPRYENIVSADVNGQVMHVDNVSTTATNGYMMDGTYIEYGEVTERFSDSSYVVHHFRNYEDTPDVTEVFSYDCQWADGHLLPSGYIVPDAATAFNYFRDFASRSMLRGKPSCVEYRTSAGILLKRELYSYSDGTSRYVAYAALTAGSRYEGRYLLPYCDLVSRTTETYDEAGNMTGTTVSYVYNALRQRRSESYADETGAVHRKDYFRVNEIPSASRTPAEAAMWSSGVTSYPVYEVESLTDGSGSWLVSSRHSVFTDTGGIFRVSSEEEAEVGPRQPYSGGLPSSLSYRPLYTFGSFDAHGRPTTFTDANGIHSLMIWGYGGLYPVAMVVNTSPPSLSGAGISLGTILPGGLSASQEASLRGIAGASVTTWKYQPSVGITEKTGPDGRKTSYGYDAYGRLISVTGPDSETISEYIYSPEL